MTDASDKFEKRLDEAEDAFQKLEKWKQDLLLARMEARAQLACVDAGRTKKALAALARARAKGVMV
jgi:hypothetical protein